jgi:ABC-type sugar transport system ATPase subunit
VSLASPARTAPVDVIRTVDLTKVYPGGVTAVDGLDLTVAEGEIFGLLGPNGAGKTTTASMLTTRVIPTWGSAFVNDIDVVKHPSIAKQLIGVVPQTNTLDRALTVWENLYFHSRFFGMGRGRLPRGCRRPARHVPPHRTRQGPRHGALGRPGAAADGGARHPPQPRHPVPRRAHGGPRPAEPHRPLGDRRRRSRFSAAPTTPGRLSRPSPPAAYLVADPRPREPADLYQRGLSRWAVYPVLLAFCGVFLWAGTHNFKRRVIS